MLENKHFDKESQREINKITRKIYSIKTSQQINNRKI